MEHQARKPNQRISRPQQNTGCTSCCTLAGHFPSLTIGKLGRNYAACLFRALDAPFVAVMFSNLGAAWIGGRIALLVRFLESSTSAWWIGACLCESLALKFQELLAIVVNSSSHSLESEAVYLAILFRCLSIVFVAALSASQHLFEPQRYVALCGSTWHVTVEFVSLRNPAIAEAIDVKEAFDSL